jgi:hypothetical protein
MTESNGLKLSLAEQGWVEIDYIANRISGKADQIVQEMQSTLEREEVVSLCSRLGICSAGFMFLDRFTRMTTFFTTTSEPSPTYKTPYISTSSTFSQDLRDEIHVLFIQMREKQVGWLDDDRATVPEYFRCLPSLDSSLFKEEQDLRDRFGIHCCSHGEMVVTTFLWRSLIAARKAGRGGEQVESALPLALASAADASIEQLEWSGDNLFKKVHQFATARGQSQAVLKEVWHEHVRPGTTWLDEWRALRLNHERFEYSEIARRAGLRFCEAIGGKAPGTYDALISDDENINRIFSAALMPLLKSLSQEVEPKTVDYALAQLESYARFPIPPFYVWNALDLDPKAYCVVPVWSSPGHPLPHRERKYYHFGLALTALRPIRQIDWTWPNASVCPVSHRALEIDPLIVTSLLRLMARPLVEQSLYDPLVRYALAQGEKKMQGLYKRALTKIASRQNSAKVPRTSVRRKK